MEVTSPRLAHGALIRVIALLALVCSTSPANATNSIYNSWRSAYPNSLTDDNLGGATCLLCHDANNTSRWNAYGWALRQNGSNFSAAESLNSDRDPSGATNLNEITLGTQPGWTVGAANEIYGRNGLVSNTALPPASITADLDPTPGNQLPVANANGPYRGTVGIGVTFSGAGSTDTDGNIVSYDWAFGDGATGSGISPSHTYVSTGTFDVTLTVTDNLGGQNSAATTATISIGNLAPTANAGGPYQGTVGGAVAFDGSGSTDADGTIVSYAWDFGDGTVDIGAKPGHVYASAGTYNVTVTVTDNMGATNSATTSAIIGVANLPPTAVSGGPYQGTVGTNLGFDGTGSTDPDGNIVSYAWDFGDGTTASGAVPSHAYAAEGSYSVTLTVTDNGNLTSTDTTTATIGPVVNQPPIANANGPYTGTVGAAVTFSGAGSTDPDGTIASYAWNFGDGVTGSGLTATHAYTSAGTYSVTLIVTDNGNAQTSDVTTATIGVGNLAPTASVGGPYHGNVGSAVAFDGSGSTDADGTIVSYAWDFGDGTTGSGVTPSHAYNATGTYSVTLTVTDNTGARSSAGTTATIAPVTSDADVFLTGIRAPKAVRMDSGTSVRQTVSAVGGGSTVEQSATVRISSEPTSGLRVTFSPETATRIVKPGDHDASFRFRARISCLKPGTHTVQWKANIAADQNADTSNDSVSRSTVVNCRERESEHERRETDDERHQTERERRHD